MAWRRGHGSCLRSPRRNFTGKTVSTPSRPARRRLRPRGTAYQRGSLRRIPEGDLGSSVPGAGRRTGLHSAEEYTGLTGRQNLAAACPKPPRASVRPPATLKVRAPSGVSGGLARTFKQEQARPASIERLLGRASLQTPPRHNAFTRVFANAGSRWSLRDPSRIPARSPSG